MSPAEINAAINRDIFEDAWQRQREAPVAYRGKRPAENLETALYLCPRCRKIGTLHTKGERIGCACGLSLRYTETGFFEPSEPFETVADWEAWQRKALRDMEKPANAPLFCDGGMKLSRIGREHREEALGRGELVQYADRLCLGAFSFPLREIDSMAMVQANLLLLSHQGAYYQIRAARRANLRKYLEIWKET